MDFLRVGRVSRVGRVVDLLFLGTVVSGFVTMLIAMAVGVYHHDSYPFATFGGDARLAQINHRMLLAVGCLWLAWAISFGRRAMRRQDSFNPTPGFVLGLAVAFVGASGWYVSIPTLNALLDFGPKVVTPVHVQRKYSTRAGGVDGRKSYGYWAVVNRLEHPDEEVTVYWPGCKKVHGIASRIVTLKLGRGAFGVPWFSRAIDCHLLTIDESPLFDDFYLGKGRAAALVTLVSVGGLSKEDAAARAGQIGLWTHAIERRSPDLRIALLGDSWTVAPELRAACPHCRAAVKEDGDTERYYYPENASFDSDVLDLFLSHSDTLPWGEGDRVYLADGKGRRVFEAALSKTDQIPSLLDSLSHAE